MEKVKPAMKFETVDHDERRTEKQKVRLLDWLNYYNTSLHLCSHLGYAQRNQQH